MRKANRLISLMLACLMLFTACTPQKKNLNAVQEQEPIVETSETESGPQAVSQDAISEDAAEYYTDISGNDYIPDFDGLDDENLLKYVEDSIYMQVESEYENTDYTVEDVTAVYVSKEYLDDLDYNSKSNVYFGYSIDEVEKQYGGTKYVFTLGDDGTTVIKPIEENTDDTLLQVAKNVAIGSGVILICVTVCVATGGTGAGATAVSMVFAAKTAAEFAVSSALISGTITAITTGYETQDWEEGLKAGALKGSEEFKCGAVIGAVSGAAIETILLKIASSGGLTIEEVVKILQEHDLPVSFLKQFKNFKEYEELLLKLKDTGLTIEELAEIFMKTRYPLEILKCFRNTEEAVIYFEKAGLSYAVIDGKAALIIGKNRIDLGYMSELGGKTVSNLERMKQGYAPIDPNTGTAFELHHVGQSVDSPLAILPSDIHRGKGYYSILHDTSIADGQGVHALMSDSEWAAQKAEFWMAFAKTLE